MSPPPSAPWIAGRARRAISAALAILLVAVLVSCSNDDEGAASTTEAPSATASPADRREVVASDLGPFDLDTDDMAGAGTPMGGGLTVPDGALLLGVPFPDLVGQGYRALLLVTGDPIAAFNVLAEQAGTLGMEETGGGCLGGVDQISCVGSYADSSDGESLNASVVRRVSLAGVVSGLGLRYRPPGSEETGETASSPPIAPTDPIAAVELPAGPLQAPAPSDVALAVRPEGSLPRSLERGSRLVGLPGPCACEGEGWSFVVELTGLVRDVMAAYGRQFVDLGQSPDISDRQRDEVTLLGLRVGSGLRLAEVRAVDANGGPDYAIVTVIGA